MGDRQTEVGRRGIKKERERKEGEKVKKKKKKREREKEEVFQGGQERRQCGYCMVRVR